MPRPPGHQNVVPGRREIAERVAALRQRADSGDALAAAALVLVGIVARQARPSLSVDDPHRSFSHD